MVRKSTGSRYLTGKERAEIEQRLRAGECRRAVARNVGRSVPTVDKVAREIGVIPPDPRTLTDQVREKVDWFVCNTDFAPKEIADRLKVSVATIHRACRGHGVQLRGNKVGQQTEAAIIAQLKEGGKTRNAIAKAHGVSSPVVQRLERENELRADTRRVSESERESILRFHEQGKSRKEIAELLDRDWKTVDRVLRRENKTVTDHHQITAEQRKQIFELLRRVPQPTVREICAEVGVSSVPVYAIAKQEGIATVRKMIPARKETAKRLLRQGGWTRPEIAAASGLSLSTVNRLLEDVPRKEWDHLPVVSNDAQEAAACLIEEGWTDALAIAIRSDAPPAFIRQTLVRNRRKEARAAKAKRKEKQAVKAKPTKKKAVVPPRYLRPYHVKSGYYENGRGDKLLVPTELELELHQAAKPREVCRRAGLDDRKYEAWQARFGKAHWLLSYLYHDAPPSNINILWPSQRGKGYSVDQEMLWFREESSGQAFLRAALGEPKGKVISKDLKGILARRDDLSWFKAWLLRGEDAPEDVTVLTVGQIERFDKAWHYTGILREAKPENKGGIDRKFYQRCFRDRTFPTDHLPDFVKWLFGWRLPDGYEGVPLPWMELFREAAKRRRRDTRISSLETIPCLDEFMLDSVEPDRQQGRPRQFDEWRKWRNQKPRLFEQPGTDVNQAPSVSIHAETAANQAAAGKSQDPAATTIGDTPYPNPDNEERDKWLAARKCDGWTTRQIVKAQERRDSGWNREWNQVYSPNGIKNAIETFCTHHSLPVPRGKTGRPSKNK